MDEERLLLKGERHPSQRSSDQNDVRRKLISFPLPRYSNLEPKVCLSKRHCKLPKRGRSPAKRDAAPEGSLVFRSSAGIVREVLLNNTVDCCVSEKPAKSYRAVCHCLFKTKALFQQLQDNYSMLLIKYAEAKNTIDQMRFNTQLRPVDLHSEHHKPSQPALSQEVSDVMTLSSRQTLSSASSGIPTHPLSDEFSTPSSPGSRAGTPVTEFFSKQTQRFQIQVDEFEELIKSGELKLHEQIQLLSWLEQGQDSLERAYMSALKQHKQLQKKKVAIPDPFDPDRKLEALILQSGRCLEELKQWLKHSNQCPPEDDPGTPFHEHLPCGSVNERD